MTSFPTTLDSHDSLEPQRAFVALYDVLGFTSRMRLKGLDQVRVGYRELTRTKLDVAGLVPVFSGLGGQYRRLASTIFSDTVLLWCDDNWEAVQTLITGAANLIATAVDMGWPLRGGLHTAIACWTARVGHSLVNRLLMRMKRYKANFGLAQLSHVRLRITLCWESESVPLRTLFNIGYH